MLTVRVNIHLLHPVRPRDPLVQMSGSFRIGIKLFDITFLQHIFARFDDRSFDLIEALEQSEFDDAGMSSRRTDNVFSR